MPTTNVTFSVVAAVGLVKRGLLGLPSPYAVVTVDDQRIHTTGIVRRTLNPHWNSEFDVFLRESSVVAVEVFDARRPGQAFLGVCHVNPVEILQLQAGRRQTLTMDLEQRRGGFPVHGQVVIYAINKINPIPPQTLATASGSFRRSIIANARNYVSGVPHSISSRPRGDLSSSPPPTLSFPLLAARHPNAHRLVQTLAGLAQPEQPPAIESDEHSLPPWMPPGWEARHAADGRLYYVDHNTRTTSWSLPSASGASQRAAGPSGSGESRQPLPAGWERRLAPQGRIYYIDHNTQTTSWDDPRLSRTPQAQPPVPALSRTPQAQPPVPASPRTPQAQPSVPAAADPAAGQNLGPLPSGWQMRMTSAGRLYYVDHNTHTTSWEDPRLPSEPEADAPRYKRDFRQKVVYFRSRSALIIRPGTCVIKLRRNQLFEDAYREIMRRSPDELKKRLDIKFDGEMGLDYGGLSREFFFLISHEMFNPVYCLFEYSDQDNYTLQINAASSINPEHITYFKFIGRCLGLAIFHRQLLDAYFVVGFYKMILKKKVTLSDLESVDATLYRSVVWMLENDISDVIFETFTALEERLGETITTELKPGGKNIVVTEENKREYVDLLVEHRISRRVKEQFDAFMSGFTELISPETIKVFDERELELLISGMSDIQVDDLDKHTEYHGYEKTDEVIQWFWKCVRGWPTDRQARLLQFVTGTSRVPVNGFKDLQGSDGPRRFTIEKWGNPSHLPRSHTCFNRIDLPPYHDYETLEQKLIIAVEETLGFGQE